MAHLIVCDRCDRDRIYSQAFQQSWLVNLADQPFHLCTDCKNDFKDWVKHTKPSEDRLAMPAK